MKQIAILLLYLAVVCGPVIIAGGTGGREFLSGLSITRAADLAALIAIAVVSMQFVLSARLQWIDRAFGLDRVMVFHRVMAVTAATLLLMHPLLLAADPMGDDGWKLLYQFGFEGEGWKILIGKATLLVLLTTAIMSLFRLSLNVEYQSWLKVHNILALCIITGGFIHSLQIGPHVRGNVLMELLWIIYPAIALGAMFHNHVLRPALLKGSMYRVSDIRKETGSVWTITMTAPGNAMAYNYLPGQFHFLTLHRVNQAGHEQHPFTISSSPADRTSISSSIKESGDHTATIGRTVVGDRAALLGPYGRFSYMLHTSERNLVFIAGGIGMTPFISMLRHMRDTGDSRDVLLLYGNRTEKDIAFRNELDIIAGTGTPRLRVVHVLEQPDAPWTGVRGRITTEVVCTECGSLDGRILYVCGPSMMMSGLVKGLKKAGVKRGDIRYERFSI